MHIEPRISPDVHKDRFQLLAVTKSIYAHVVPVLLDVDFNFFVKFLLVGCDMDDVVVKMWNVYSTKGIYQAAN